MRGSRDSVVVVRYALSESFDKLMKPFAVRKPHFDLIYRDPSGGALWQGNAESTTLGARFDMVVLCAEEWQPLLPAPAYALPVPLNDDELTGPEAERATRGAQRVACTLAEGKKVLVTCMEGRNRSGLVSAIALVLRCGMSGYDAQRLVQKRRQTPSGMALSNPSFQRYLQGMVPSRVSR